MASVGVTITFVGGPRDGESSRLVSGEPPGVLVVDESGGRYVWGGTAATGGRADSRECATMFFTQSKEGP